MTVEQPQTVFPPATQKDVDERHPLLPSTAKQTTQLPAATSSRPVESDLYGYMLMGLSTVGFSGQSLLVRIAEDKFGFPAMSAVFVRAIIQTSLAYIYITRFVNAREMLAGLSSRQWKVLAFRGIVGSIGIPCMFSALRLLPVGDAVTIFFTGPVITMLLSSLVLAEPVTLLDGFSAVLSFSGVVLVARPGFAPDAVNPADRLVGSLLAFAAAVTSSTAYIAVRSLGTSIHFMASVFSLGFASFITSAMVGGAIGPVRLMHMKDGALTVLLSSFFAFAGQCCLNKGLQHCRAGPGVLVRNIDVPLAYILGLLFLGETPSWFSFAGSCMVLGSTLMIGLRQLIRS